MSLQLEECHLLSTVELTLRQCSSAYREYGTAANILRDALSSVPPNLRAFHVNLAFQESVSPCVAWRLAIEYPWEEMARVLRSGRSRVDLGVCVQTDCPSGRDAEAWNCWRDEGIQRIASRVQSGGLESQS